jgi:hypothetical protein
MPKSTMRMGRVRRSIPLEKLSQLRILERLRDAHGLARRGIGAHATRIRELLDDVRVRLDAMDVVARVTSGVGKEAGASRAAEPTGGGAPAGGGTMLRCVMRSELGRPVSEFRLLPFGEVDVERALAGGSFTFTRAHAEAAVRWFNELQRKLAIDYEHQSVTTPGRPDGLRPAAGWIGGLEIRDDGLWATRVEWTPKARQLLEAGEYRYFSPVIYWADEDYRELVGLGPVALTNDPAMHGVPALAATRGPVTPPADRPAGVGDADRGRFAAAEQALAQLQAQLLLSREESRAARAEVAALRQQLAAQEADAFVERGMRLGKILDSTSMDWRQDYLRDPAEAEQRLARSPVLRPPGRILTSERVIEPAPVASVWGATGAGRYVPDPADVAAYERACAAGRVRRK